MPKCKVCGETFTGATQTLFCGCECKRNSRNASRRISRNRYKHGEYISRTIAEVREREGLRPLQPGKIPCLKCNRVFNSKDKVTNRLCNLCKGIITRVSRAGDKAKRRIHA